MTPAEHYAEAERLLALSLERSQPAAMLIDMAQVHATLAAVAPAPNFQPVVVSVPDEFVDVVRVVAAGPNGVLIVPDSLQFPGV